MVLIKALNQESKNQNNVIRNAAFISLLTPLYGWKAYTKEQPDMQRAD